MILNTALKAISPFVPIAGSAFGFDKTCIKVYNATNTSKVLIAGVKGLVIECTPPVIKYPLLCAGALACTSAACITGDANFVVVAFECCSAIVEG